ncbi:MAG: hypothetical protein JXR37_33120 [Kiritimatiellae bacterium]|nr:hypothetical protein [Kiritimatiellia bacterium]
MSSRRIKGRFLFRPPESVAATSAVCACLAAACLAAAASPDDTARLRAADEGLQRFLVERPAGERAPHGIPKDIARAKPALGTPFPLYRITPAALAGWTRREPTAELLSPTTQYYFPVLVDGVSVAVLIVDRMRGQWKAVSLGHARLAAELGRIRAAWPESDGFHPQLVVVPQAQQHFFTVPEKGGTNLTLVRPETSLVGPPSSRAPDGQSVGRTTSRKYRDLSGLSDVIPALKREVEACLGHAGGRER